MAGSLITIDVMIGEPGVDFEGGTFITPNADGTASRHVVAQGDAIIFLSHKYHNVEPVTRGLSNPNPSHKSPVTRGLNPNLCVILC